MSDEWIIGKSAMLQAIKVMDLVPARPGILSSEFYRLSATKKKGEVQFAVASEIKGEFTVTGEGRWPFEKSFYLDRRVFTPFVLSAGDIKSDAAFHFKSLGKSLSIRHGKRRAQFTGQPPLKGYGFETDEATQKVKARLVLTDRTRYLMRCALNCAGNDQSTPQLNCVFVLPKGSQLQVYAYNKVVQFRAISKDRITPELAIPFPLFLVSLLDNELLTEVQWKGTYVCLIFKQGMIWQPVSIPAKKKFPASTIDHFLEKGNELPITFEAPTRRLAAVVARLSMYLAAVRRQDWLLTLSGQQGTTEITMTSTVPQTVFKEKLTLDAPLKKTFEIHWPLAMLQPVFEFVSGKDKGALKVRLKGDTSYVTTGDLSMVIPGVA